MPAEDLYKNKIKLIYEYNSGTPLFVRIAYWELEDNNIETAIEILNDGLRENPEYPTPYFILGKAYSQKTDYNKALKCYKKGSELIHSEETFQYYYREIESLRNLKTPPELRMWRIPEENEEKKPVKEEMKILSPFEDNLDELAKKISNAKIPVIQGEVSDSKYSPDESTESSMLVSETLAKIYLSQGEIQEAITIYQKLSKKEPAKEEYFLQKIDELKSKL